MQLYEIVGILYDEYEKLTGKSAPKVIASLLSRSGSTVYKWKELPEPDGSGSNLPPDYFPDVQALVPTLPLLIEYEIKKRYGEGYSVIYNKETLADGSLIDEVKDVTGSLKRLVDLVDKPVEDMDALDIEEIIKAYLALRLVVLRLEKEAELAKQT